MTVASVPKIPFTNKLEALRLEMCLLLEPRRFLNERHRLLI